MPQKRNPDAAELVRAKVGRIAAAFQALLMVMKGLPLAYAKDMQEDKELTFDALASLRLAIAAMTGMVDDLEPNADAMRAAAGAGYSTATDLADWLVRSLGLPVPRGPPRHRPDRGRRRGQGRGPRRSCRWRPCRRSSRASPATSFPCCRWRTRSRAGTSYGGTAPQNVRKMARGLDKAVGKAAGKGLELPVSASKQRCFPRSLRVADCEQGSPGQMHEPSAALRCDRADRAGGALSLAGLRRARLARGAAEAQKTETGDATPGTPGAARRRTSPPSSTR